MKYICIILLFFFFYSCRSHEYRTKVDVSNLEEITIDPQMGATLPMDSLIENIDFIKLETKADHLIGKISQILFAKDLLFVVDSEISKSINVFDLEGHFKYMISHLGTGPGEYVEVSNVCIVPGKEQIAILDRSQGRIIYYKYNGQYVSMEQVPFMNDYFEYLNSGNRAYEIYGMHDPKLGNNNQNSLIVADSTGNLIFSFFKDIYRKDFHYTKNRTLRKFEGSVYYSPNISDTIYLVKDSVVEAKYYINITQKNVTNMGFETREQFYSLLNDGYFFNGDFIELKDFTYINIMAPWGYPSVVYVHSTKKAFLNSGVGSHPFFSFLMGSPKARYKENCIVCDVPSYIVLASKTKLYGIKKSDPLLDPLFDDLTEDSNPILFFFHLNKNLK
ncbi:6-bladed beta-propeller [uncultured Bacteroides sp.]|uniref:6-bladed beta-propeller n=1 Tax=uncultured Bacteroides sp. TaxID=162156 RepID=UPI002AABCCB1|nr:6-bladed beta-propeller [uncultured Bacteroides sp.]